MLLVPSCRASCRSPLSYSAEALMSGAEPTPEIRHASRTQVRYCDWRVCYAAAIRRRFLMGFAAAAGLAAISVATPAQAQTLTAALAEAYNTNPQLLAQRALLRSTDEQVPQALSFWRPTVNFTGQVGYSTASFQTAFPTPPTNRLHIQTRPDLVQLQAAQPIYRGGRTVAQTRQAITTVESTRAQTLAVETTVFQAVAMAYLDVVRDQALLEVDRNNVNVLREQLEATQDRFRVGEVTRTDVAQAEYVRAVGRPPGRLTLPRERPVLPATLEEAESLAATSNFNVISAVYAELAARDNIDVVRGQLLPQISLVGSLSRASDPSVTQKGDLLNQAQITAQLTMPLYEGGAIYSQTRQAEQTVGQRRSQVDDARRLAVQTANQFWATLQAARASIASFAAAVRAAQIALAGVQQQALVGTSTTLDVLIQNQQLLTTQSQLITAQHDAALAEFNVAAAVGRLIAPELKLPVKLYDMEQHYKEVRDKWIGFRGGLSE